MWYTRLHRCLNGGTIGGTLVHVLRQRLALHMLLPVVLRDLGTVGCTHSEGSITEVKWHTLAAKAVSLFVGRPLGIPTVLLLAPGVPIGLRPAIICGSA